MTRSEFISQALDRFIDANSNDVQGAVVVGSDGMLIASRITAEINPDRVGAIAATMMGVTNRVVSDLKIGKTYETIVSADNGYLVVYPVAQQVVLAITLTSGANLGLARLEAREMGETIANALVNEQQS